MPNNEEARARGAAWTFDAAGVVNLIRRLNESRTTDVEILAPAFGHTTKDPVSDAITIPPSTSIVIIEGNWLLYDGPGGRSANSSMIRGSLMLRQI
jgi:pantothenate kinase